MKTPKLDPSEVKRQVAGSVDRKTEEILKQFAVAQKRTLAKVVGEVLDGWAEGQRYVPEVDSRQYILFDRDQEKEERGERGTGTAIRDLSKPLGKTKEREQKKEENRKYKAKRFELPLGRNESMP